MTFYDNVNMAGHHFVIRFVKYATMMQIQRADNPFGQETITKILNSKKHYFALSSNKVTFYIFI